MNVERRKKQITLALLLLIIVILSFWMDVRLFLFIPSTLLLLFEKELSNKECRSVILFCICIFVFNLLKVFSFSFMPQALSLYSANDSLLYWFKGGHLHSIRLLIAYPGAVISNLFRLSLDEGTTVYVSGIVGMLSIYLIRALKMCNSFSKCNEFILLSLLMILSTFMNGRLLFAFLGIMIIIDVELRWRKGSINIVKIKALEVIGLILTMVSSGTMAVTTAYIIFMSIFQWRKIKSRRNYLQFLFLLTIAVYPILHFFVPYFVSFLQKNISYYGGGIKGITGMLQHGVMSVLGIDNFAVYVIVIFLGICAFTVNAYVFVKYIVKRDNEYLPLLLIINLCIYGGLFGISTALLCTLPASVFLISKLSRKYKLRFQ